MDVLSELMSAVSELRGLEEEKAYLKGELALIKGRCGTRLEYAEKRHEVRMIQFEIEDLRRYIGALKEELGI